MTEAIKALVVEDHFINQELVKEILEDLGCVVIAACHGGEALDCVRKEPFDIIFMDLQMPEMDGYEATRRIRAMEGKMSEIPIVALTASALEQDKKKCFDAGITDYVTKPYEYNDIKKVLDKFFLGGSS